VGRKARLDLVLDCSNAEQLMGFWRDALGYGVYYSGDGFAVLVPGRRKRLSPRPSTGARTTDR
jgi:hypothetical protein